MASITLRSVKGSPLTNNEIDSNFINIDNEVATKLDASAYTAADVLAKVLTVHGIGSQLNADFLDGLSSSSTNLVNSIVARNASGNFSAGTITANLIGNVTGNVTGNAGTVTNGVVTTATYSNPPWLTTLAGTKVTGIPNSSLVNSSILINGTAISLGGSINILGTNNIWTAPQVFRDSSFYLTDELDTSKVLTLQLSGITSGASRVLFAPDESGTISTQAYTQNYVQTAGRNSQGSKTISSAAPSGGVSGDVWYRV